MSQLHKRTFPYFVFQKCCPVTAYQKWKHAKNIQNQLTQAEDSHSHSQQRVESDCFKIVKNYRQLTEISKIRRIRKQKIKKRGIRQLQSHFKKIQQHREELKKKGISLIDKQCLLKDLNMVKEQVQSQNQQQNETQNNHYLKMGVIIKKPTLYKQKFAEVQFQL